MGKNRYNQGRRHQSFVPAVLLVSLVAMLVGMSAFFRVTSISVQGVSYYSGEQISDASGIRTGASLLLLNPSKAALNICSELMFVKEVRIDKQYPGTVQIVVTESMPVAYIRSDTDFWTMDSDGQLLEKTMSDAVKGLIGVRGVSQPVLEEGKLISSERSPNTAGTVAGVLQALTAREYSFSAAWIDIADPGNITINCGEDYTIALGSGDKLEEKLTLADAVIAKQESGSKGTVDVSAADAAHFIPASAS